MAAPNKADSRSMCDAAICVFLTVFMKNRHHKFSAAYSVVTQEYSCVIERKERFPDSFCKAAGRRCEYGTARI
jgi:hypothetical protein